MVAVSSNKLYFWKWLITRDVLILSFSAHTHFVCASRTPICLGFSQLVFYIFYLNNLIIETCLKTGPMRAQEFKSEGWQSGGKKSNPCLILVPGRCANWMSHSLPNLSSTSRILNRVAWYGSTNVNLILSSSKI